MYYKRKSNIMFRDYGEFGYLTDNRNYRYKAANDYSEDIGDKIISKSGSVFISALGRTPRTVNELAKEISVLYADVNMDIIKEDLIAFFSLLEKDGFLVSGNTMEECDQRDIHFSYRSGTVNHTERMTTLSENGKVTTQQFFDDYYHGNPHLASLHIEITSTCNERCVHCYIPHENKINSMPEDLFFRILDQCIEMNLLHITITGGEPMLHDSFVQFLKKCNDYNFSVNVLSNLTLLNSTILEEMKQNPLLCVQTSVYSMEPTVHDAITGVSGSFEKTMNGIAAIIENNIPLQISCPILKQNKDCYEDVITWGRSNNIRVNSDYVILAKYDHSTQNLRNRLSVEDVAELLERAAENDVSFLQQIREEAGKKHNMTNDDSICSVCNSSLCISETGNIYPCAGWQDFVLGNAKNESIREVWECSNKVAHLRALKREDFPQCGQCENAAYCTMCLVRNANESQTGDPCEVNSFFCKIAAIKRTLCEERYRH